MLFANELYTVLVTVIFLERWQIIFAKNKIFTLLLVCYIYKTYICYILIKTI